MKITNKFLAVFICLLILVSGTILPAYAAESEQEGGEILESLYIAQQEALTIDEDEIALQGQLNNLYQTVEKAMQNPTDNISSAYSYNRDAADVKTYSDTYAGSYIDDNVLVVCVTDKTAMNQVDSSLIQYRLVENSYNNLDECKSGLTVKYQELYQSYKSTTGEEIELLKSIAGFGVDEELNAVIVDIADLTAEKETLFISLFGANDNLVFQEAGATGQDSTSYKPGQRIRVITARDGSTVTYSLLSIGYRAYRSTSSGTEYGFATCGHGIKNSLDGNVYSSSGAVVGTISAWRYSGSVDASFVKLSSGNSITITTMYSDEDGSTSGGDSIVPNYYMTSVAKGSTVYKVGATTYRTSAEVTNTNYDFTPSDTGVTFTNLTKTKSFCEGGDSGGMVYMYYNGGYKPAGIIKGMGGWWLWSYSVYVKASEVVSAMSIYPY